MAEEATPELRTIARTNPKAADVQVVGDRYYNDQLSLTFQSGSVPMYGVRNGVFEEDLLLILIDRARLAGNKKLESALQAALGLIVPADVAATTEPTSK